MEGVTYPDGEVVAYGYDAGGQVTSVTEHHYGHDYLFVTDIGYDEFGQRTYIRYGNGVRTDYEYNTFVYEVRIDGYIQSIDPSRITEKSNEFRTTIDGIETTVRFYVQNGQVINIDAFVGYSERVIGNLIQ